MTATAHESTSAHQHEPGATGLLERAWHETDPAEATRLREQVLVDNHEMATDAAGKFEGQGVDREDLDQVAMLALVQAIRRYRPDQDGRFRGSAASLITGDLTRYVREHGQLVPPPRGPDDDLLYDDTVTLVSLRSALGLDSLDSPGRQHPVVRSRPLAATIRNRGGISVMQVSGVLRMLLARLRPTVSGNSSVAALPQRDPSDEATSNMVTPTCQDVGSARTPKLDRADRQIGGLEQGIVAELRSRGVMVSVDRATEAAATAMDADPARNRAGIRPTASAIHRPHRGPRALRDDFAPRMTREWNTGKAAGRGRHE